MASIFDNSIAQTRYIPKITKHEESIQKAVCRYIRLKYPQVIFRSDYASGIKLTRNQAVQHASMQSGRGFPDLFIYHKSASGKWYGLALELKRDGETVYLKNGTRKGLLTTDVHIQEQAAMLQGLRRQGFYADFAVGYTAAIDIIDKYFGNDNGELF